MNKDLHFAISTGIVVLLNLVIFLYLLADFGINSAVVRGVVFTVVLGLLSVFYGYFVEKWWLVFLGVAGILFLGIRAIFLIGGINVQWFHDFTALLGPLVLMEAFAFSGSRGKKLSIDKTKQ